MKKIVKSFGRFLNENEETEGGSPTPLQARVKIPRPEIGNTVIMSGFETDSTQAYSSNTISWSGVGELTQSENGFYIVDQIKCYSSSGSMQIKNISFMDSDVVMIGRDNGGGQQVCVFLRDINAYQKWK